MGKVKRRDSAKVFCTCLRISKGEFAGSIQIVEGR